MNDARNGGVLMAESPQVGAPGGYGRFCPELPGLGAYVDGLGADHDSLMLDLFCACAGYGSRTRGMPGMSGWKA